MHADSGRRLLVMRHAKSDWGDPSQPDSERPLNDRGHRAAGRMGAWMAEHDLIPDRIMSSSAVRTRQTVQRLVDGLALDPAVTSFHNELYLADAGAWVAAVRSVDEEVETLLICGHNPGFDDLVAWLTIDRPSLSATGKLMTTATVAHFSLTGAWADLGPDAVRLERLVRPRELGDGIA